MIIKSLAAPCALYVNTQRTCICYTCNISSIFVLTLHTHTQHSQTERVYTKKKLIASNTFENEPHSHDRESGPQSNRSSLFVFAWIIILLYRTNTSRDFTSQEYRSEYVAAYLRILFICIFRYGIYVYGGAMHTFIYKNTSLPAVLIKVSEHLQSKKNHNILN